MNRRGNIMDILYFTITFFIVVIVAITLNYGLSSINDVYQNESSIAADAKTTMETYDNRIHKSMDSGIIFALIAVHIGIIFLGVLMRSHPLLFPVLFLALMVIVMVSAYISDAYDEFASTPELQDTADNKYPMSSWVLDNFVMVTLVFGFVDILAFLLISSYVGGGGL